MKKKHLHKRIEVLEAACMYRYSYILVQREEIQELAEVNVNLKDSLRLYEDMQETLVNNLSAQCPDLLDLIETLQTEVVNLD